MGSTARHLTASSALLVPALIAVASLGFTARPDNGKVEFRALTDTLGNAIGIEFRITDPDKIATYGIFRGVKKPGMGNQESWWPEDCTKTTVTNSLTGAAHVTHEHVISYADCEADRDESSWATFHNEDGSLPTAWTEAIEVSFGSDENGGEDQRQAMSEKTLMWTQVAGREGDKVQRIFLSRRGLYDI